MQHGPFRATTVLVCGYSPPDVDALIGVVQGMGGNTQSRFHTKALPHIVVCGNTLDESYRVRSVAARARQRPLHAGAAQSHASRRAPAPAADSPLAS
jgi:hypothetical protein